MKCPHVTPCLKKISFFASNGLLIREGPSVAIKKACKILRLLSNVEVLINSRQMNAEDKESQNTIYTERPEPTSFVQNL